MKYLLTLTILLGLVSLSAACDVFVREDSDPDTVIVDDQPDITVEDTTPDVVIEDQEPDVNVEVTP